ncbi:predicted protein [Naegleria gruberi]|uniref:Predicted protein n=1 Tax=Naegleria gruberi TaxID=5762 RepID=D2VC07_NAEGR|nr:uncharacterized protein NAEGRDRAFT_66403 [Naegleria gruberi]EFC45572.1 predicted protein [Naegleria gruberi]|eukprot:XP_002678316.1 predicted protein [Naegleria gruberi strain NEG-M]
MSAEHPQVQTSTNSLIELEEKALFHSPSTPSTTFHQQFTTGKVSNRKKRNFIINTKYGSIELSIERILSFIVMFIAVISLFILTIITFYAFVLRAYGETYVYSYGTESLVYSNRFSTYLTIILNSNNVTIDNGWLFKINYTFSHYEESIGFTARYNADSSKFGKENLPVMVLYLQNSGRDYQYLYSLLVSNKSRAVEYSNHFVSNLNNATREYLEKALYESDKNDAIETLYMDSTAIIGTILCGLALLIILPTGFIATFGRNNKLLEKLQKVNAKEVLKTVSDTYLNTSFKEYCKNHQQLKYFLFLEKSLLYSEYCEEIFNLNSIENYLNGTNTNSIETRIDEFESKKCEIIFETMIEFLSSKGEYFLGEKQIGGKKLIQKVNKEFKSNPMNLPENLLDEIESNISICLISTLKSFQSTQKQKRTLYNFSKQ